MRYAIRCTPGGLVRDELTDTVLYFNDRAEAETEALRLTQEAYNNPRVAGFDFTAEPVFGPSHNA